ncbi:hypothetical protein JYU34_011107 [Plutella xylostella]|uniref:NADPH:adrenodoxin oxidoreductase, mitochondrial n=1 Tax=Plutella xylostella TaxID=51655 RepID=A0ABQ7QG23_PLUXY|nr:hypothetical protein JYU34_011107 [Plutella xylostella]
MYSESFRSLTYLTPKYLGKMSFKIARQSFKKFSTACKKVSQVCVVGAGPAGFYAAMQLTKKLGNINIDIIEKLPVPFGLIRYGVAPDHLEVKNVINQFTKVAQQPNVNFYGNIALGKDITLSQLRQHYDAVLLTYGAEEDKLLGIENEDAKNIVAARKFVGWYNGLPDARDFEVDLGGNTAAVLGQGNVALDVARIILSPIDELRKTDIPEHVLSVLAKSKIKELYLVGRRGPLQAAFTIKELREQLKIPFCQTVWRKNDFDGVSEVASALARPRKRLTELMLKSLNEHSEDSKPEKYFKPIFHRSPDKFIVDSKNNVMGVQLTCNQMAGSLDKDPKYLPTDEKEIINCSLAIRSIGYKSVNVDKDLIIGDNGSVANDKGRILDPSNDLAKLYVAGWLGTGPVGVILHTMGNAFQVAKAIQEDLETGQSTENKGGFAEVRKAISDNLKIVDWKGWENIDKYEIEMGKKLGKPREKICCVSEMLEKAL